MSYQKIKDLCAAANRANHPGDVVSLVRQAMAEGASPHDLSYNLTTKAVRTFNKHAKEK